MNSSLGLTVALGAYCAMVTGGTVPTLASLTEGPLRLQVGAALFTLMVLYNVVCLTIGDPLATQKTFLRGLGVQEGKRKIKVDEWIDGYNELHKGDYQKDGDKAGVEERESSYAKLVNAYYELATLFYEWGWGQCFHFATLKPTESFIESIRRHEYYLASKIGVTRGQQVLDCGCGVGGPGRNIAAFTGANVTGITLNEYQVQRGNDLAKAQGISHLYKSVQGDFMKLPFEDNHFDGVFAIEATCHAPDRVGVYSEIFRTMKPGATFATYEWCLTDKYDKNNEEHRFIKKKIEEGDGLPDIATTAEVDAALKAAGFELIETEDVVHYTKEGDIPWYIPMTASWKPWTQRFQFTWIGLTVTPMMLQVLEFLRLAPKGTCKVQRMLQQAAIGLAKGGANGTFTPMYLCVARKPLH